ncbi:hypothetical protein RBSWK_02737 [Rhodopirellula baltica SWK14]|uniref:Uncharacterized protein n=1 Tax=Rhodopirellula baltica SWK14 TaxID=993516 RepID=L7CH51_RHOBT|nr:hypothetical protein RBSWK_02737 [Rhodopirellula baltica SWK14]
MLSADGRDADCLDGATWFGAQRKRPSETTVPASQRIDLKR